MQVKPQHVQVLFTSGGLGDNICRIPAVAHALREYQHLTMSIYVHDYFLSLAHEFNELKPHLQSGRLTLHKYSDRENILPNVPGFTTSTIDFTPSRMHLLKHAMINIADEDADVSYPTLNDNGYAEQALQHVGPYAVVCTGYTAKVRSWPVAEVNKVIDYLVNVAGIKPVLLGNKSNSTGMPTDPAVTASFDEGLNVDKCVDLREQTALMDAFSVLKNAIAVFGVDNGLLHLAACCKDSGPDLIAGYTSVDSKYRAPVFNNPQQRWRPIHPQVACRFCQSRCNFVYEYDFRNCMRGDEQCTKEMKGELFIRQFQLSQSLARI